MRRFTFTLAATLCVGSALASAPSTSGTEWKKTQLLDDFTGANGKPPSSANWIMQTGTQYPGGPANWGSGEVETYTNLTKNVKQAGNGNLWIIPVKDSSGAWTSGRIETVRNDFQAPAGGKMRVEARIKMPAVSGAGAQGYWPAFWMIGGTFRQNPQSWPAVGEVDIMEAVNGATNVVTVMHCDVNPNGACNEPTGLAVTSPCQGSVCPGNFHVYEVIIDRSVSPELIKFWIDRKLVHAISENDLGTNLWAQTVHKGYYLILNVAMGGSYPNAIAGTTTPTSSTVSGQQMAVDYVAVWTTS